ncbi:Uncharacterised protein [Mycobacteroides abscessus subsp. abscessus]|nr:Uncharacterised protein [Mycobacteroides abscessus subsp. abscessus]
MHNILKFMIYVMSLRAIHLPMGKERYKLNAVLKSVISSSLGLNTQKRWAVKY